MPIVQYWPVGSTSETSLTLTQADISRFLLDDWLPDLPVSLSQSVMGWPQYLIEVETGRPGPYFYLSQIAGWSERQWKGVLSWMLGVAGTRKVLDNENYSHIAPCSAFYPESKKIISIPSWLPSYPPSVLEIEKDPRNISRLRPDYITARCQAPGIYEFALVESKGTSQSLKSRDSCPNDWRNQARNAIVYVNGVEATIPRHLVVATRSNPNAIRKKARRLQIRAWNSQTNDHSTDNRILVEIVSAHYAALLRNLNLIHNLKALKISAQARLGPLSVDESEYSRAINSADDELSQLLDWNASSRADARREIHIENTLVMVQIANAALFLIRNLRSMTQISDVHSMLNEYLILIKRWYADKTQEYQNNENISIDRSGFMVKMGAENQNEV